MRTATLLVAVGALVTGCKKKPAEGVENATGAPASTTEIDALWALAPEGATIAIVASPHAVAMAEHAWLDVRTLLATAPELMPVAVTSRFAGAQIKPRADGDKTAGFGVINLAPMLTNLPPVPLVGGVTLADLAASLGGPVTLHIPPGSPEIDLRIPVKDPKPAATLLEHCAEIPPLAAAGAAFSDGACHVTVPSIGILVDMWVDGQEVRIGKKGGTAGGVAVPMTALGAELAKSEAAFAFWGRGTLYGQALGQMPKLPSIPAEVLMGIRGLSLLNELGGSVRIDGDKIKVTLALRTLWSNPDDVVAKLAKISPETFLAGTAGDAAKAIAEGAPGSPFAADYKAGTSGLMAPMAVVGMLAAVAVPAFMDYMKKGKTTEASLMLLRLAKASQAYYIEHSAFPIGEAPLTPATPCCQGTNGKCDPAGAAWQQELWTKLDFQIDEPTRFQYRVHSDGKTLEAEAIGDLDCDGITVTYKMHAVGGAGTPVVTFEEPAPGSD